MQPHYADNNQRERHHLERGGRFLEIEHADCARERGAHAGPDRVRHAQFNRLDRNRIEPERARVEHEHHDAGGYFREAAGELHAGSARDFKHDRAAQEIPG